MLFIFSKINCLSFLPLILRFLLSLLSDLEAHFSAIVLGVFGYFESWMMRLKAKILYTIIVSIVIRSRPIVWIGCKSRCYIKVLNLFLCKWSLLHFLDIPLPWGHAARFLWRDKTHLVELISKLLTLITFCWFLYELTVVRSISFVWDRFPDLERLFFCGSLWDFPLCFVICVSDWLVTGGCAPLQLRLDFPCWFMLVFLKVNLS